MNVRTIGILDVRTWAFIPERLENTFHRFIPTTWHPTDVYYKFKRKGDLEKTLLDMATGKIIPDIPVLMQAFEPSQFTTHRYYIAKVMKKLNETEIERLLEALFQKQGFKNIEDLLKNLSTLFTVQKTEEVLAQVKLYAETASLKGSLKAHEEIPLRKVIGQYIIHMLDWIIENIILIFQLKDVTDDDANKSERAMMANLRYQIFKDNIVYLSVLLYAFTDYTGSAAVTALVTTTVATSLFAIYYIFTKYFKPGPEHLHPARNITKEVLEGKLTPVQGCEDDVREMLKTLRGNLGSVRQYPFLTGPTGIGKSSTVNALAYHLCSDQCDEFWKGITVYSVNAADLINNGAHGFAEHLELIRTRMKGQEGKIHLHIEEAQVLFDKRNTKGAQLFKSLMDEGGFPFMSFGCPEDDFIELIESQDTAFRRRVKEVNKVSQKSDQASKAVKRLVRREASDVLVDAEAIAKAAYTEGVQPFTAKKIMADAIATLRSTLFSDLEKQIEILQKQIEKHQEATQEWLNQGNIISNISKPAPLPIDIKANLAKFQSELVEKKKEYSQFQLFLKQRDLLQAQKEHLAVQIDKMQKEKKSAPPSLISEFYWRENNLLPVWESKFNDYLKEARNNNWVVTKELIKKCIEEDTLKKAKRASEQ